MIFFVCLISKKSIFTLLFNNKLFDFAGKYAYSIYMMQQIAFYILEKTFWQNTDYVHSHFVRTIVISTALSAVFGVISYYVVEKPSWLIFKKVGKKLFSKEK